MKNISNIVILGTGLKECLLSSLLTDNEHNIIQIDKNEFNGGEMVAIAPLQALYDKFQCDAPIKNLGEGNDWNVNIIQKFLMVDDDMTKLLMYTGAASHLDMCRVEGDFVSKNGHNYQLLADDRKLIKMKMPGYFEKRRFRKLIKWAINYNEHVVEKNNKVRLNPFTETYSAVYRYFGVNKTTQDIIGHTVCLYSNDTYKTKVRAIDMIIRVKRYYNNMKDTNTSPYIYPLYGIGEITEAFSHQKAIYNTKENLGCKFEEILYDKNEHVAGVKCNGITYPCDSVICDPSYAKDKVRKVGSIIRAICLLDHPISETHDATSTQIIIPHSTLKRRNDIYVTALSDSHKVTSASHFVAVVATKVETECPKKELSAGIQLLGKVEQIFYENSDLLEPINDGVKSGVFVTSSYDATPNFESTCEDVKTIYEKCTGKRFDITKCITK